MDVPITGKVVEWAMRRSGLDAADVATQLGEAQAVIEGWINGTALPNKGQARALAGLLGRQVAFFLRPTFPVEGESGSQFRRATTHRDRIVEAHEREVVRRVQRRQLDAMSIFEDGGIAPPFLGMGTGIGATLLRNAERQAEVVRRAWDAPEPIKYPSVLGSSPVVRWAEFLGDHGVFVFRMRLMEQSAEGITVFHRMCPAIVLNTNTESSDPRRVFTLFHELGHVVLRGGAICETTAPTGGPDVVERWCNAFAGAFLMPAEGVRVAIHKWFKDWSVQDADVTDVSAFAKRLRVSVLAAAVRLNQLGLLRDEMVALVKELPRKKRQPKESEEFSRSLAQLRLEEFGRDYARLVLRALDTDIIGPARAAGILRIDVSKFDQLRERVQA
jgi:Zn-dependent peptidase ImmA (M78 family)